MKRPGWMGLVMVVVLAAGSFHAVADAEKVRSRMISTQGEAARTGEASDGEPATSMALAVRGEGKMLLSYALFGFQSDATKAWTLHVDTDVAANGESANQVAYHVEISSDEGTTWQSLRAEKAPLKRLDLRFDLGEHPAAKLRAKVTLYFLKDGKAAGAMSLYEVYLTAT